jgi:hypothetical protein
MKTNITKIAKPKATGEQIRAKIAANREKRLSIAELMKREAGVTEHTIHKEDAGGLAYIGTGRILSPEGRNILQLTNSGLRAQAFWSPKTATY